MHTYSSWIHLKDACLLHVLEDVVCECEAGSISHTQPDTWNAENPHNIHIVYLGIIFWEKVMYWLTLCVNLSRLWCSDFQSNTSLDVVVKIVLRYN